MSSTPCANVRRPFQAARHWLHSGASTQERQGNLPPAMPRTHRENCCADDITNHPLDPIKSCSAWCALRIKTTQHVTSQLLTETRRAAHMVRMVRGNRASGALKVEKIMRRRVRA